MNPNTPPAAPARRGNQKYDIYPDPPAGKRRPSHKKKRHPVRTVFRILLLTLLCVLLIGGIAGGIWVRSVIKKAPDLSSFAITPTEAATYIYNSEGNREQKLTLPESNRDLVSIDRVPQDLQLAFVAIEDARFYTHDGVDLQGILRALLTGIASGRFTQGASTITQQLLKNTVFTDWTNEKTFLQSLERKIQEQYLATQLEKELASGQSKAYAKKRVLEDYLNVINLGAGCYGVQSAAYRYFGKDVSELTLSECTVIAGITQNPSRYNPITNPEENAKRRVAVLDAMKKQHYISQAEYDDATADPVYERIQSNEEAAGSEVSVYTFYQDALIDQVLQDLMEEKGYTYKQAYKAVYAGGLRIYSAQDASMQQICDEEFANVSNFPVQTRVGIDYALSIQSSDGAITHYGNENLRAWIRQTSDASFSLMFSDEAAARDAAEAFRVHTVKTGDTVLGERITITAQPQASMVIIDQSTGYVKALVGGRGEKKASLTLNRATYTLRQPGSTFKILAAFAPALDMGGQTLATVYENTAATYDDGTPVGNWDISDYGGNATIREAIVRSINVAAVRCITKLTPKIGYDYVKSFGISSLVDGTDADYPGMSDLIQPLALGGITRGVTNLELCGAYACIANQGKYIEPKFYTKVTDHEGNLILDNEAPLSRTVLKETTAYLLTSAMQDVIADPTGTAYEEIDLGSMPVAGKTGTTNDYRDIWFAGYTPYYTCCVWGGYDNNEMLDDDEISHNYDKVLWNAVMTRIHAALPVRDFSMPANIITAFICPESGMLATGSCQEAYTEYFTAGTQPADACDLHSGNAVTLPGTSSQPETSAGTAQGTDTSGTDTQAENGIVIVTQDEYTSGQGTGQSAATPPASQATADQGTGAGSSSGTQTAPQQIPPGAPTLDQQDASDAQTPETSPAPSGAQQPDAAPGDGQEAITIISDD